MLAVFECKPAENHILRKVQVSNKSWVIKQRRNFRLLPLEGEKKRGAPGREAKWY